MLWLLAPCDTGAVPNVPSRPVAGAGFCLVNKDAAVVAGGSPWRSAEAQSLSQPADWFW